MRGRGRRGKLTARDRLWCRVVEATGSGSVAEAKARVAEREFRTVWVPYLSREPSVGDRLDYWFPVLIAMVVNSIPFRGGEAVRVADLAPDRWGDRPADDGAATRGGRFRGKELGDMLKAWAGG